MDGDGSRIFSPTVLGVLVTVAIGVGAVLMLIGRNSTPHSAGGAAPMGGGTPAVAPLADLPPVEGGITQRPDGMVFIHSGAGSVQIRRNGGGWSYGFGYRPQEGGAVDVRQWEKLIQLRQDRKLQEKVHLTDEQRKKLAGAAPCPQEDRAAVEKLFENYVAAADGSAKERAKAELLERVRQTGETQGPLVARWLEERFAVLTPQQRADLYPRVEQ
jgi:hypothetical protein